MLFDIVFVYEVREQISYTSYTHCCIHVLTYYYDVTLRLKEGHLR